MKKILALHRRSVEGIRPVLAPIGLPDLDRPTPCAGWDLRALLEHMTGQDHGFARAVTATRTGAEIDPGAFAPRPLDPSPAATLRAGLDDVVAAFAAGAAGPVPMPEFGAQLPLDVVVQMHLVDTLVHGWDVAATLGVQDDYAARLDAEVVGAALAMCEQIPDDASRERAGAPFAHALPAARDADAWTCVLTSLGRDPAWTAGSLVG
ncbi:TIGR03086 family metal-binding protein [Pseudonocardia zijingensis]|jgi:uncharacterized protein (TIGR03086 family)|uniref:TIGR03086 family metal-binding protein n=1 Tax=Pseudonocardia zijingensis TaxID=153376 RepID=A0ABP3ZR39_9PSEU